jgi:CBS domain-containing protein
VTDGAGRPQGDLGGGVLVSDVMTAFPAYIRLGATMRRAAEVVSVSEVGQLMVLDHDGRFVGSLSEEDMVRALLPGFDDVTVGGGTLADAFRIFLERGRALAERVIDPFVVRDAATVRSTDELARAAIVMIDRGIRRLPRGRRREPRRHAVAGRSVPCGDLPFLSCG